MHHSCKEKKNNESTLLKLGIQLFKTGSEYRYWHIIHMESVGEKALRVNNLETEHLDLGIQALHQDMTKGRCRGQNTTRNVV